MNNGKRICGIMLALLMVSYRYASDQIMRLKIL